MSSDSNISNVEIDWTGEIFKDKYYMCKKIGEGSFAKVWVAYDITKKYLVAIKVHNLEDYSAGKKEAELLNKLKSKNNIVTILDSFENNDEGDKYYCIVLELMACSVHDVLKNKYKNGLPYEFVRKTIKNLCYGIKELHNLGFAHTDIKPENMLLTGENIKFKKENEYIKSKKIDKIIENNRKKHIKNKEKYEDAIRTEFINLFIEEENMSNLSDDSFELSDKLSIENSQSDNNLNINDYTYGRLLLDSSSSESEENIMYDIKKEKIKLNLEKAECKLSDFGTRINLNGRKSFHIQTRYYRAPEIILGHEYNTTCDIWSIGCTLYELLTGKILFDPDKSREMSRDRNHLYDIQMLINKIPKEMIEKSKYKDVFFRKNGLIKSVENINFISLKEKIINNLKDKLDVSLKTEQKEAELNKVINFISSCLIIDVNKRFTIDQCLKHEYLI
jgi:serine/threonine-protein kinase SRPK3